MGLLLTITVGLFVLVILLVVLGYLIASRIPFIQKRLEKVTEKDFSDKEILEEKMRKQLLDGGPHLRF